MKSTFILCALLACASLSFANKHEHHQLHQDEQKIMEQDGIDDFDDESFFLMHDKNRDGVLDKQELIAMYHALDDDEKPPATEEEPVESIVDALIKEADLNGDGVISKDEFMAEAQDESGFDVDYNPETGAAGMENIPLKYQA